jgi:hypothetical protein
VYRGRGPVHDHGVRAAPGTGYDHCCTSRRRHGRSSSKARARCGVRLSRIVVATMLVGAPCGCRPSGARSRRAALPTWVSSWAGRARVPTQLTNEVAARLLGTPGGIPPASCVSASFGQVGRGFSQSAQLRGRMLLVVPVQNRLKRARHSPRHGRGEMEIEQKEMVGDNAGTAGKGRPKIGGTRAESPRSSRPVHSRAVFISGGWLRSTG